MVCAVVSPHPPTSPGLSGKLRLKLSPPFLPYGRWIDGITEGGTTPVVRREYQSQTMRVRREDTEWLEMFLLIHDGTSADNVAVRSIGRRAGVGGYECSSTQKVLLIELIVCTLRGRSNRQQES